jgi:hypothetical protein
MKNYLELAKREIEYIKRDFTENSNTFSGLSNELNSFKEELVKLDVKLKVLGNDYVLANNLNEQQTEEIKKINHDLVSEFINGTGLSFIGTK